MKPEILFIVDTPNWALDFNTEGMKPFLSRDFIITKRYQHQMTEEDIERSDLIVVYYVLQFNALYHLREALRRNERKLLFGICSHVELEGNMRKEGLPIFEEFASGIFVISLLLYEEFHPLIKKPIFYTPMGVDTKFFSPKNRLSKTIKKVFRKTGLRIGWAGSISNFGDALRGVNDFIVPATQDVGGVELITAKREDKWRTQMEMRKFYQSLDVYICASRAEGTPNPCLEAAACGIPIITTPVGNMPQLIKNGINGFFVKRDIEDIKSKLKTLRDNPLMREQMGVAIRESILEWDWKYQSENYRFMFRDRLQKSLVKTD